MSKAPAPGLNLGFVESDRRANVEENRRLFFEQLRAERFSFVALRQVHSAQIYKVIRGKCGTPEYRPSGFAAPPRLDDRLPAGDSLLTDEAGFLLCVRSADCLPVLLVDPRRRAVAALHAGWRGALERIVEKTVGEMRRLFESRPRDLLAAIGPSIRVCCYEVGEEVLEAFRGRFKKADAFFQEPPLGDAASSLGRPYSLSFLSAQPPGRAEDKTKKFRLDLVALAREQLQSAGLKSPNIQVLDFCTSCRTDLFFSHRKEGSQTGRMMAVIGIRP